MLGIINIISTLAAPITGIIGGIKDHFADQRAIKKAKVDSQIAVTKAQANSMIRILEKGQTADIKWNNLSIQNSGWKDEWFTVLLSLPMIICFIPGGAPIVAEGFKAINENVPEWYQYAFMVAVASAFGFKKLTDFMSLKKGD